MTIESRELFSHIQGLVRQYSNGVEVKDNPTGVANMGKVKEVTDFMKNDVSDMERQAGEIHALALQVKEQFASVSGLARSQLTEAQKDLMELQASMGGATNFPPDSNA